MGKKVNCSSEEMDYNTKSVKAAAQRSSKSDDVQTDYSIDSKKMTAKDRGN
jgi:hypothetical protein